MSRSLKKGPFIDFKLAKKVDALADNDRTIVKTWARSSTISPDFVGKTDRRPHRESPRPRFCYRKHGRP
jgi:ribosomal protein S19